MPDEGRSRVDVGGADDAAFKYGRAGTSEAALWYHQFIGIARRDAHRRQEKRTRRRVRRRLAGLPRRGRRLPQRLRSVGAEPSKQSNYYLIHSHSNRSNQRVQFQ